MNDKIEILLVDDKPENLLVLEELLSDEKRVFRKALSGNEALKIILNHPISLILLDVQMPEMDGFEVAKLIKSNKATSDIPIIFITAISKEDFYIVKGLETGAIDYLTKPLNNAITKAKVKVFEELHFARQKQKEQYEQLQNLYEEITEINKQKDYLLGMAAHDLRNPVAAISQICDLVFPEIKNLIPNDSFEMLEYISKSSQYMLTLLSDLLDVSKIQSGKLTMVPKKLDVEKYVDDIYKMQQLIADKKGITILKTQRFQSKELIIDGLRLEQVLNNLISNAIKFSPPNSTIHLHFETNEKDFYASVKDEGPGIPDAEQNKLFKAFQRISTRATGGEKSTGLGLAICQSIIVQHGGNIGVKSSPGDGSEFYFTVPMLSLHSSVTE